MFHDSFWVTKRSHPAGREDLRQAGRVAEHVGDPHLGAAHARSAPRSSAGRARSGGRGSRRDGRFMSASTHMPPTGIHCPPATLSRDALRTARARAAAIHSYCWACEHDEPVAPGRRPSGRRPRRTCGCTCAPSRGSATATPCRCGRARWRRRGGRRPRPASPAPARARACVGRAGAPSRRRASSARASARSSRGRRWVVERAASRITPSRTSRSCSSASASASTTTSSARSNRYSGSSPAVAGEPSGDGRNCGNDGFDAASTIELDGPGSPVDGARPGGAGGCPAPGGPSSSRTSALALEPGRVGVGSRGRSPPRRGGRTTSPGPSPREAEPRRAPRRAPRAARPRTAPARRASARPRPSSGQPLGVDERQHPLVQLAGDPLLDQLPVVVHPSNVPPVRDSDRW